jgi:hypothetical protein
MRPDVLAELMRWEIELTWANGDGAQHTLLGF